MTLWEFLFFQVVAYSGTLLEAAGVTPDLVQYFVLGIGVWNVLVTIVSLPLLERIGRRTLLLWPSVAVGVSLIILTLTVNLVASSSGTLKTMLSVISVADCYLYMTAFALGLGPIPGLIVAEVTRQDSRAAAYSLSQALQWISNIIVVSTYPSLDVSYEVIVICETNSHSSSGLSSWQRPYFGVQK